MTGHLAVNENGQLITKNYGTSEDPEYYSIVKAKDNTQNDTIVEESMSIAYGDFDTLIASWGKEEIAQIDDSDYTFTLPAKDGLEAQEYVAVDTEEGRRFSPTMEVYNA